MGAETGIQWTDRTWNPWRGCTKVADGCANCYMFAEQTRYGKDPSVVTRCKDWRSPIRWDREAAAAGRIDRVFVCSWSDFWHPDADPWRREAFDVIDQCGHLVFQIPTKRPERIRDNWTSAYWMMDGNGRCRKNVWLGYSASTQNDLDRGIEWLLGCRDLSPVLFLSLEPLLESVELSGNVPSQRMLRWHKPWLPEIDWVIVGGESGQNARPFDVWWARGLRDQCRASGMAFFFKQAGANPHMRQDTIEERRRGEGHEKEWPLGTRFGTTKGLQGTEWQGRRVFLSDPKGGDLSELPEDLRVREMPRCQS